MDVVTFTTLYPSCARPNHGIFVETRLRELVRSGLVNARIVAPVPWFPSSNGRYGEYAAMARTPPRERRHGLDVSHPRYVLPPKIGMTVAPFLLAACAARTLGGLRASGFDFELIDAHYFYPDGVAAALVARRLRRPVIITARGSDLNVLATYRLPRRMICWAARQAAALVTVSAALKNVLVGLGVPASRVTVLRNGIDLQRFTPIDRDRRREELGLHRRTLLCVGNLVPLKGHDIILRALVRLPDVELLVVGTGPEETALKSLAANLGVAPRVRFLGTQPQTELRLFYGAADALVLASSTEGWPNVLLESMACGTPVVATDVGGVAEVVAAPEAGLLVDDRTPDGLERAVSRLFACYPERAATRRYAERFSWEETTRGQLALFGRVVGRCEGMRDARADVSVEA